MTPGASSLRLSERAGRTNEGQIQATSLPIGRITGQGESFESLTETSWGSLYDCRLVSTRPDTPFSWRVDYVGAGQIAIIEAEFTSPIALTLERHENFFKILIPSLGGFGLARGSKVVSGDSSVAFLVRPGQVDRLEMLGDQGHAGTGLILDGALMSDVFSRGPERPAPPPLTPQDAIDLRSGAGRFLKAMSELLVTDLQNDGVMLRAPAALSLASQALLRLIVETRPQQFAGGSTRSAGVAPRHVKRAIDFMHGHLHLAVTVNEMAAATGVSVRSLTDGFRQFRGTSPLVYFRKIRLAAVRQALLDGPPSGKIAEAAFRFGFTHLGRFAAYYRAEFGELPSDTLRR